MRPIQKLRGIKKETAKNRFQRKRAELVSGLFIMLLACDCYLNGRSPIFSIFQQESHEALYLDHLYSWYVLMTLLTLSVIKLFADDTSLSLALNNPDLRAEILNHDLEQISQWVKKNEKLERRKQTKQIWTVKLY